MKNATCACDASKPARIKLSYILIDENIEIYHSVKLVLGLLKYITEFFISEVSLPPYYFLKIKKKRTNIV